MISYVKCLTFIKVQSRFNYKPVNALLFQHYFTKIYNINDKFLCEKQILQNLDDIFAAFYGS